MSRDPEYLEECVRRLVKAGRLAMNVMSPTCHLRADLANAIAFARPHDVEAKEHPNPQAFIRVDNERSINPAHVVSVEYENRFYANGHDSRLVVRMIDGRSLRVDDTSGYLGGTDIHQLKARIEWAVAAGWQS